MSDIEKFFDENPVFGTVVVTIGILFLVGIIWIGRSFTPTSGEVLTSQNWQIMNSRKAYTQELNDLIAGAQSLSRLLNTGQPDPIQGQIVTDTVQAEIKTEGHSALFEQRTTLSNAAVAVRSWSQGAMPYEDVYMILNETILILQSANID
jgi:hypothetical protein